MQGIEKYGRTGEAYVGQFLNDTRWGLGTAYYANGGPKYIGPWVNGIPQGSNGTLFLQNGQKYVGEFDLGRPWGQGLLYGPDGDVIKQGNFGPNEEISAENDSPDLFFMPKIKNFGLNLTDNKYANLLKQIFNFVKTSFS